ncbi:MAG: hypothetical protein LBG94_07650 [Treponema sp.]|jgi:hypothetical protein|nr:hypothetical protein [Treponema sp.]
MSSTANSQQPTANSQQPTANSQQPTANSQQPTANSQQPTANSQQYHCNNKILVNYTSVFFSIIYKEITFFLRRNASCNELNALLQRPFL